MCGEIAPSYGLLNLFIYHSKNKFPFLNLGEYSKTFTLNVTFYLLKRIWKLSNVFHKEKEVFKETKETGKWLDTMLLFSLHPENLNVITSK